MDLATRHGGIRLGADGNLLKLSGWQVSQEFETDLSPDTKPVYHHQDDWLDKKTELDFCSPQCLKDYWNRFADRLVKPPFKSNNI